jgi:hypothetical protein
LAGCENEERRVGNGNGQMNGGRRNGGHPRIHFEKEANGMELNIMCQAQSHKEGSTTTHIIKSSGVAKS